MHALFSVIVKEDFTVANITGMYNPVEKTINEPQFEADRYLDEYLDEQLGGQPGS